MNSAPTYRHRFEALGLRALLRLVRLFPVKGCSNFGGFLGRNIGPSLGITRKADLNLKLALPELSVSQRKQIIRDMWDNLGRVIFEYPHLREIVQNHKKYITVSGLEKFEQPHREGKALLFIGAHIGNWEILPMTAALLGYPQTILVRQPNNPLVAKIIDDIRTSTGNRSASKGVEGARASLKAIRNGEAVGLLADQKMNDGIEVPFFGIPAMSPAAPAILGAKADVAVFPIQCKRTGPASFHLTCHDALAFPSSGKRDQDSLEGMSELNRVFESWIRETPGQWLWLHRRWPKAAYKKLKEKSE
ncbi:lysophospholipid acyltransferase family protein [Kiloniella laminariae]|uniref:lysophospholipid acyltransferase family protein n=1 Tax=Kiloniella laminariae TaxID=454162 RepID=UPI00037DE45C|nr:lysophospholipid acyltransferase family protein [Kiloniella laminariae]